MVARLISQIQFFLQGWGIVYVLALLTTLYFASQTSSQSTIQVGPLAAEKSYGVSIDLTQYDDEALTQTLAELRANGLVWLRQPVRWANIEPEVGQFYWDDLDRIITAATNRSFNLILVLETTPGWARPPHTSLTAPPTHLNHFGRFAQVLARRYEDKIDHYQIWHEPNLSVNWGYTFIDPIAYTKLLREAALNIREADSDALILTAALAPTLENGPLNLNEMAYLDEMYQANAAPWVDIVAGQLYGFDVDAATSPRLNELNFRRLELLREVMIKNGDAEKPIWATALGWNALPTDWNGRPPSWRQDNERVDPPEVQVQRTNDGLAYARQQWPWLGPIMAIRWDEVGLAADDPTRGFALTETGLLPVFQNVALAKPNIATVGNYAANHTSGQYGPNWRITEGMADIPLTPTSPLTITFEGQQLDIEINRGPYRGFLYVTIDGELANALPRDSQGQSYVSLFDPLAQAETVTLAQGLTPGPPHQAVITAEGGWGQWAIAGWVVSNKTPPSPWRMGILLFGTVIAVSGVKILWLKRGQWFSIIEAFIKTTSLQLSDTRQIVIFIGLAITFYLAPQSIATILFIPLVAIILYRPDLGLVLIVFSLSFFQNPKSTFIGTYHLTETPLILSAVGFGLRYAAPSILPRRKKGVDIPLFGGPTDKSWVWPRLNSLDFGMLALLIVGYLSALMAENFGVAMQEWRILFAGAIGFYLLLRLQADFGPNSIPERWRWRLLDTLTAGAALHAIIVLWRFGFGNYVTAEDVYRAVSPFYASPNNLALFLGRIFPILFAIAILPTYGGIWRRRLYSLGLIVVSLVIYLTFSRGTLLLAIPLSLCGMALVYGWQHTQYRNRLIGGILGGLTLLGLAIVPLRQTARFQNIFSLETNSTAFFRLKLWQSSLNIIRDHWLLGLGPDNFLYAYRTRYILPEAWQEPNLSHPHNLILDFATRLGIGGVIILLWLQLAFWQKILREYQHKSEPHLLGLMGSMLVFLSHGLIDHSFFLVDLAFLFSLSVALIQNDKFS